MKFTFSSAYAELRRAQKPARGVSFYSRLVNRKLGRLLAALGASTGISPNLVTAASCLATAAAVALLALDRPSLGVGVGVAGLLVLGFALDSADGQLARLTRSGSLAGEWLDHVVDAAKSVALHAGVLVAAYRHFDISTTWLLVPIGYQLTAVVVFAAGVLRELLGRVAARDTPTPPAPARRSSWSALILLPADFGILAVAFLTLAWPPVFVVVYSALFLANLVVGATLLAKWLRELRALGKG